MGILQQHSIYLALDDTLPHSISRTQVDGQQKQDYIWQYLVGVNVL